jgi:hypothetical protein
MLQNAIVARSVSRTATILGLCLFLGSFFLPAVQEPRTSASGPGSVRLVWPGWECAEIAPIFSIRLLQLIAHPTRFGAVTDDPAAPLEFPLLALSGWINPLVLLYLLSYSHKRFARFRRFVAWPIVVCLSATCFLLLWQHFHLLVGYFLWTAGILLFVTPTLMRRRFTLI